MTNDKISRYRAHQTHQRSNYLAEAKALYSTYCNCPDATLWCFQTTGLSLYPPSTEGIRYSTHSGAEGGLYGKTTQDSSVPNKRSGKIKRGIPQPHGNPSLGDFSQKGAPWLKEGTRYRCSIALTAWVPRRLTKPIVFWSQARHTLRVKNQTI